jgi:hypothetical protein
LKSQAAGTLVHIVELEQNQSKHTIGECKRGGFFLRKKPLCGIALGYSYSGFAIAGTDSILGQRSSGALPKQSWR